MPFEEAKHSRLPPGTKGAGEFSSQGATGDPVDPKKKPQRRAGARSSARVRQAKATHHVVTADAHRYAEEQHAAVATKLEASAAHGAVDLAVPAKGVPLTEEQNRERLNQTYATVSQLRAKREEDFARQHNESQIARNTPMGAVIAEHLATKEGQAMKPSEVYNAARATLRERQSGQAASAKVQKAREESEAKQKAEKEAADKVAAAAKVETDKQDFQRDRNDLHIQRPTPIGAVMKDMLATPEGQAMKPTELYAAAEATVNERVKAQKAAEAAQKEAAAQKEQAATAQTAAETQAATTVTQPVVPRDAVNHLGPKKEVSTDQLTKDGGFILNPRIKYGSPDKPESVTAAYNAAIGLDPKVFRQTLLDGIPFDPAAGEPRLKLGGAGDLLTLSINGKLKGGGNLTIWRTFRDNGKTVEHDLFEIKGDVGVTPPQDQGIGKKVLGNFLKVYDSIGTENIRLQANCEVGGYAWARYGFVPDKEHWENLKEGIEGRVESLEEHGAISQAASRRVHSLLASSKPASIRDLAALSEPIPKSTVGMNGDGNTTLGKALLLGTRWDGGINLNKAASYSYLKAYLGKDEKEKAATVEKEKADKQAAADKAAAASLQAGPISRPKVGLLGPKKPVASGDLDAAGMKFSVGGPEKTTTAYNAMIGLDPAVFRKTLLEGLAFDTSKEGPRVGLGCFDGNLYVTIDGRLTNGNYVNLSRRFTDGGKTVEHDSFKITNASANASGQGNGVGKQVLSNFLNLYNHMGVTKINVQANCEVGGYAWARYGFTPEGSQWRLLKQTVSQRFKSMVNLGGVSEPARTQIAAALKSDDPRSIRDLAALSEPISNKHIKGDFGPPGSTPLGKALLLETSWGGGIDLKDPASYAYLHSYLDGGKGEAPATAAQKADAAAAAVLKASPLARPAPAPARDVPDLDWDSSAKLSEELEKSHVSIGSPDAVNAYNKHIGMGGAEFLGSLTKGIEFDTSNPGSLRVRLSGTADHLNVRLRGVLKDGSEVIVNRSLDLIDKTAEHELFTIKGPAGGESAEAGKGVGKAIMRNFLGLYDRLGTKSIKVHANIDVGGYAWARYGFVPDESSWAALRSQVKMRMNNSTGKGAISEAARQRLTQLLASDDPASAFPQIAALSESIENEKTMHGVGLPGTTTLGKSLLLGTNWQGEIDLTSPESYARFKSYTGG